VVGEVRRGHPTTQMIVLKPREVEKDPKGGSTPRWGNKEISNPRIRRWENREWPRRDAFD